MLPGGSNAPSLSTLDDSALARDSPVQTWAAAPSPAAAAGGAAPPEASSTAALPLQPGPVHPNPLIQRWLALNVGQHVEHGSAASSGAGSGKEEGSWSPKSAFGDSAAGAPLSAGCSPLASPGGNGGQQEEEEEGISEGFGDGEEEWEPDEEAEEAWYPWQYGADLLRHLWRRHEALAAIWILLALFSAVVINIGVGVSNSQRRPQPTGRQAAAAAWAPPPPARLPPPRMPAPPPPPAPPSPPPTFCDAAPADRAPWRYSNVTAVFEAPPAHYAANLVSRQLEPSLAAPAYYNGVVPRFCIVGIEATFTCMKEDRLCNLSPDYALNLCQTACPNDGNNCQGVVNLAGHPLQERTCGLYGLSKPSCISLGYSAQRLRQLRAYYKLNVCQAPPGPRPPPPLQSFPPPVR